MMTNLIYDRTLEDVAEVRRLLAKLDPETGDGLTAAEQAKWDAGLKGAYNFTDLNRVESAVKLLAAALTSAGYPVKVTPVLKGSSRVPSGFTEVEWIQSTGTQYIDTGVSAPEGCRVQCKVAYTSLSSTLSVVFGSHDAASPYYRNFLAATSSTWELGAYGTADFGSPTVNTEYEIDANTTSGEIGCSVNGNTYTIDQSIAPSAQRSALSVYLFALHYADGLFPAKMKAWWYKVYVGGTLVRDFVPCKNPSGAVGLYDTVNGTFYGNSGTGVFTAGAEISALEDREWRESDIIRLSQWRQYLANVQALRDAYYTLAETGQLPAPEDKLGYVGANNIEKVLADIDLLIDCMKSSYRRCGTFRAGNNAAHLPLKGSV